MYCFLICIDVNVSQNREADKGRFEADVEAGVDIASSDKVDIASSDKVVGHTCSSYIRTRYRI